MPFDVGDKVVYPHHGAADIEKREKKEASARSATTSSCGSRTATSR